QLPTLGNLIIFPVHQFLFTEKNGVSLIQQYDFVVDATDNFESKFIINDICVQEGIAFCHAGISGLFGQVMTIVPGKGPCYRCVFKNPPETEVHNNSGTLGAIVGVLGSIQAGEAIKYLVGYGKLLIGRMITFDGKNSIFREIQLPDHNCRICLSCRKS
ncbi:MAG: ThiF family adenylyltransferase, partial [Desulfobacterales bacterium]|nr:ThiF family adenylyltransferase [Desulfobacterales bacterium]